MSSIVPTGMYLKIDETLTLEQSVPLWSSILFAIGYAHTQFGDVLLCANNEQWVRYERMMCCPNTPGREWSVMAGYWLARLGVVGCRGGDLSQFQLELVIPDESISFRVFARVPVTQPTEAA